MRVKKKYNYRNIINAEKLPDELEKKKDIFALKIALNIILCKFSDALVQTVTNMTDLMLITTISKIFNAMKTVILVCRKSADNALSTDVPLLFRNT